MLIADADALTGGGIVGGVVTAAGALYVIYEKVSKRRTEARRERLADEEKRLGLEEQQIKIDEMARASVKAAYEEEAAVRKRIRDAEIAALKADIDANKKRLADLEGREQACQDVCAALTAQNAAQAAEIRDLRAKIERLEAQLRAARAIPPGTDTHEPLP